MAAFMPEPEKSGVLRLLNIEYRQAAERKRPRPRPAPFVLWRENESAYAVFCTVANHGQWQYTGIDNVLTGINGSYLIDYLKLTVKPKKIPALLDAVFCIVSGWVTAKNENRDTSSHG